MIDGLIIAFLKVVIAIIIIDLSLFAAEDFIKDIIKKYKEFYEEVQ